MWTTETVDLNWPDRRRAGQFVQSGRTSFFPVPVLRTSTTGRTVTFVFEVQSFRILNGRRHCRRSPRIPFDVVAAGPGSASPWQPLRIVG